MWDHMKNLEIYEMDKIAEIYDLIDFTKIEAYRFPQCKYVKAPGGSSLVRNGWCIRE